MPSGMAGRLVGATGLAFFGAASAGVAPQTLASDAAEDVVSLLQHSRGLHRDAARQQPVNFWAGKNGDLSRTGASAFAAPSNISAGPAWSFDGGLVRAAPLIDAEMNIYLGTIPGFVYKMSPTGAVLWKYKASADVPEVPAIADGLLFATSTDGYSFALDMATGAEVWRVKIADCTAGDTWSMTASSSVVIAAVSDIVGCNANTRIVALNPKDGSSKWDYKPDTGIYNFLSAIVEGSVVFSDLSGRGYRLDAETGSVLWKFNETSLLDFTTGGAVVGPNRVVYVTSNVNADKLSSLGSWGEGRLTALDFDTGKKIWSQTTGFQANNAAAVGVLHPSGKGPLSVVIGVGENPGWPPQRAGRKAGKVLAFDAETGKPLEWEYDPPVWQFEAAAGDTITHICLPDSFSNPAIGSDGTVYIGFEDGRLYAMRDANGDGKISDNEVSSWDTKNAFQGSPGIAPGMLVATPCNGMHVFTA